MDHQVSQCAVVQGDAGPVDGPGQHYLDRGRILPVPENASEERRQGMNRQRWYYAHLRWAVMVEGKEGLRHWEEAVHIFLSDDRDTAFQRALEIGHQAEHSHDEGRRWVESRLAQVVKLDCLGADQTEFEVVLGSSRATETAASVRPVSRRRGTRHPDQLPQSPG